MEWDGLDSVHSWLISLACCFINMITFGMARLSGVLFVASIPRFKVGRKQASFPYTFASCLRNVSGPLVGYLGHKFGVRTVTSCGALIGALGAGLCYFAETIDMVTILWGALFGLGFGLGNVLLPIAINQHFDKHRATASGISFSGACLGSFVLPPIVEILLKNYGLSQTYLLLSGFILNCVPAALLLRKPNLNINTKTPWKGKETDNLNINSGKINPMYTLENDTNNLAKLKNHYSVLSINPADKGNSVKNYTALTYEENMKRFSTQTVNDYSDHMSTSEISDRNKIMQNGCTNGQVNLIILQKDTLSLSSNDCVHDKITNRKCPVKLMRSGKSIIKSSSNILEHSKTNEYPSTKFEKEIEKKLPYRQSKIITGLGTFSVIFDPMFILIAITNGIYTSSFVCMVTIIVDFSRDLHIQASYEKYILMLLSVGDIVGRLGLGWITDRGYMTTTAFCALCFACQGLFTIAIAWSKNFISLCIFVILYGLAQAGIIVIFPIIMAKFIELDKQIVAIPSSHFLSGPLCLAVSPLIGYFRDEIGSYNWIFYGITMLSVACSVSWIFAPCIDKCRRKI